MNTGNHDNACIEFIAGPTLEIPNENDLLIHVYGVDLYLCLCGRTDMHMHKCIYTTKAFLIWPRTDHFEN